MRFPLLIPGLLLTVATSALGTTYTINPVGTGDFPNIQAAIDAINGGDIVELVGGTYTDNGNRDIDFLGKAITIRSQSGVSGDCVIDCQGSSDEYHRGFIFQNNESVGSILDGIVVINGWHSDGGAVYIADNCSPTINNCIFSNNIAQYPGNGYGGAIYCYGSPSITSCNIVDNFAGNRGGGIYAGNGIGPDAIIADCFITNNSAEDGGGIHCRGTTTITGCLIMNNHATWGDAYGGGISCRYHSGTISRCTVVKNEASLSGGIAFYGDGPFVEYSIIAFSSDGGGLGWGVAGANCTPTISCCAIWSNVGGYGDVLQPEMIDSGYVYSADPCFCDVSADDFALCADSWCLPENHPWGCSDILIGALGNGCVGCSCPSPVKGEPVTWGNVKIMYR